MVQMSKSTSPSEASQLLPDFQTDLVRQLEALVGALPEGVAHLSIGRVLAIQSGQSRILEIIPRNPQAALSRAPLLRPICTSRLATHGANFTGSLAAER